MGAKPWKVHGPFYLNKNDERSWPVLFREAIKTKDAALLEAAGVYVIGAEHTVNVAIRYVGLTFDQGFGNEVCSQANVVKVWVPLEHSKAQRMVVWLLAKSHTSRQGFASSQKLKSEAHHLEEMLIMLAKAAGHKLINEKKTLSAEGKAVSGLFGAVRSRGRPSTAAKTLAESLKL